MSVFNPNEEQAVDEVVELLKKIAESGNVEIPWNELKEALTTRLQTIIANYAEQQETKENQYDEPNVERFNLDHSRDEILDLIASFTEPPFTIQRICELLHSPFKYYDRISTFLRGVEKNLRVISSNDWPKYPAQTNNSTDSSAKQSVDSSDDQASDMPALVTETMASSSSSPPSSSTSIPMAEQPTDIHTQPTPPPPPPPSENVESIT